MSVFDLNVGDRAKVVRLNFDGAAANRLFSLGFSSGKEIKILGFSLFKSSVLLGIGANRVALRREEAEKLEVEICR